MSKNINKVKAREDRISWDECFMKIAHIIADRSPDPSTQAGALVASPDNVVVGVGYNGWPRGIKMEDLPWDRDGDFENTKYAYVCHAEENAIFNSNSRVRGCRLYCTLFPCNECAKAIIQNGIKEVIYESDKYADVPEFKAGKRMLKLAKVSLRQYISK